MQLIKLLEDVSPLVRIAGRLMTGRQTGGLECQAKKGTANFVTETDYAVQSFLQKELGRITPEYNLVSEESSENNYDFSSPTWMLDPVDGTTNLMFQLQHSAISLALLLDGTAVLAIVYNPYLDELFTAAAGHGAWLNNQPIKAGERTTLADSLIGFGTTPYDRSQAHRTFTILEKVFMRSFEIRRSGAAVLDLAYIACGRLDGFFELTLQPWDYAAGILLIQEAGGVLTNWKGEAASLKHPDSIVAANRNIHQALLELISQTR